MRAFLEVFWPYIYRYRWLLVLGYVTSMVSAGISLSVGLIINARLDDVLADPERLEALTGFLLIIVAIVAVQAVAVSVTRTR